eukprot:scaffold471_cov318-Ochromonas_danica.AAC.15
MFSIIFFYFSQNIATNSSWYKADSIPGTGLVVKTAKKRFRRWCPKRRGKKVVTEVGFEPTPEDCGLNTAP